MHGQGPFSYGSVRFESGLEADIISIHLAENSIVLTSIAEGPHAHEPSCKYEIVDICGNVVLPKESKKISPVQIPELQKEESSIVTLKILLLP